MQGHNCTASWQWLCVFWWYICRGYLCDDAILCGSFKGAYLHFVGICVKGQNVGLDVALGLPSCTTSGFVMPNAEGVQCFIPWMYLQIPVCSI